MGNFEMEEETKVENQTEELEQPRGVEDSQNEPQQSEPVEEAKEEPQSQPEVEQNAEQDKEQPEEPAATDALDKDVAESDSEPDEEPIYILDDDDSSDVEILPNDPKPAKSSQPPPVVNENPSTGLYAQCANMPPAQPMFLMPSVPPMNLRASAPITGSGGYSAAFMANPMSQTQYIQNPNAQGMPPAGIPFNSAPQDFLPLNRQYLDTFPMDQGSKLFADVFKRADLNDDGALTFEEFQNYFSDGIISEESLLELFNRIDLDSTGNISLPQLFTFFRQGYEPFSGLFESLSKVHSAISSTLTSSHQNYLHAPKQEQFKTRFYLKEFLRQIEALSDPIDGALDSVAQREQFKAAQEISSEVPEDPHEKALQAIEKITNLQEKLTNFQQLTQNEFEQETFVVVSRTCTVIPNMIMYFRDATREYMQRSVDQPGCRSAYIRQHETSPVYTIYEIWEDAENLNIHHMAEYFKLFQKNLVDCVATPVGFSTICLPQSWWAAEFVSLM